MALPEADAATLAAALVTDGVKADRVYTVQWGEPPAHRGGTLVPRDFTARVVITAVIEAWQARDPDYRLWRVSSAYEDEHWRRPQADVRDAGGPLYHGIGDTPWDALAQALLAWAQAKRAARLA